MTLEDLADFKPLEREPMCGPYRQWRLCSWARPAPAASPCVQILGMLQRFPSSALQPDS